jgi:hypothetical protein
LVEQLIQEQFHSMDMTMGRSYGSPLDWRVGFEPKSAAFQAATINGGPNSL